MTEDKLCDGEEHPAQLDDTLGNAPINTVHNEPDVSQMSSSLVEVWESAAKLQEVVPDAVLVGETVSAADAGHRLSFDHDHDIEQLKNRYEAVLEAVEATDGWATSVRTSAPPMTIMGKLGGIEAGLRQLRRTVPLQTQKLTLPSGNQITIPTEAEALRVKAYLVVHRNQVRDYLDVAALSDHVGIAESAQILAAMDDFYTDRSGVEGSTVSDLVLRLHDPNPRDHATLQHLSSYKGLAPQWHNWEQVTSVCAELAQRILDPETGWTHV